MSYPPQWADSLAGPEYVDELAGLEGLEAATDDQILAALGGLSAEELGARYRAQTRRAPASPAQRAAMANAVRQQAAQRAQQGQIVGVQRMPIAAIQPPMNGVPARGLRKVPLPLGAIAFVVGGATAFNMTGKTARPFKGTRLVVDVARTGATATGLVTITEIKIGQDPQPAAAGALPAAAFAANAFDTEMDLTPQAPGIETILTVQISAAPTGAGDRVDLSAVLFGFSIQG